MPSYMGSALEAEWERFAEVSRAETVKPTAPDLILSGGSPLNSARQFILHRHTLDGIRTLHHQNGTFYDWQRGHYVERAPEEMRAALYGFLDGAKRYADDYKLIDFDPTKNKVANVLEATAAELRCRG